jgi:hypothetical protein
MRKKRRKKTSPRAMAMKARGQMSLKKSRGASLYHTPRQCSGWRIPWGKIFIHVTAIKERFLDML